MALLFELPSFHKLGADQTGWYLLLLLVCSVLAGFSAGGRWICHMVLKMSYLPTGTERALCRLRVLCDL